MIYHFVCKIAFLFLIMSVVNVNTHAQFNIDNTKISTEKIKDATDGLLFRIETELSQFKNKTTIPLGKNNFPLVDELITANRFINLYDKKASNFNVSNNYIFFNAVINPENTFAVFMERIAHKPIWNLWLVNLQDNSYIKLFDETSFPKKKIAPLIFGWDEEGNLMADAFRIDWSIENNGLLKINPDTKEVTDYTVKANYIGRPLLSPDGKYLSYLATTDKVRDILHSPTDELWLKDLQSGQEQLLANGKNYSLIAYGPEIKDANSLTTKSLNDQSPIKRLNQPNVKLPYPFGSKVYITRHGHVDPPANCTPGNGQHCYTVPPPGHPDKIALDWSNKGPSCNTGVTGDDQIPIVASTAGLVTHAGDLGTCGKTVKISSTGDGTVVRYCHLSSVSAILGDVWFQGGIIGREGNTGNSNGEHLHQDFFAPSEEPSTRHYVKFADAGNAVPYFGYSYVSQNSTPIGFPCGGGFQNTESKKAALSSCIDLVADCGTLQSSVSQSGITLSGLQIHNIGLEAAVPYSIGFYLSPTNSLGDATILGFQNMFTLLGYSSATIQPQTYNIPNVSAGNYYLITVVDVPNVVNDEDTSNNYCFSHGPLWISATPTCFDGIQNQGELGIDCGGPCPSCSPQINLTSTACLTPIVNGDNLTVLYELTNLGTQASGSFNVSFYAYKLGQSNPNYLNMDQVHGSINGNTSLTFSKTVNLQSIMTGAGLTQGEYRIGILIDDFQQVAESNENDNFCVNNSYFEFSTANLINASYCASSQVVGDYLNVYHEIVNEGSQATGIVSYQIFVYDQVSFAYYPLGATYSVVSVPANGSVPLSAGFHLETEMAAHGLPPRDYEIAVFVDYTNLVTESNENDNFCLSSTKFTYHGGCNRPNGFVEGYYSGSFDFDAPNFLISPNTGNECVIPAGTTLDISGGNYLEMRAGFTVELGGVFVANIEDCAN